MVIRKEAGVVTHGVKVWERHQIMGKVGHVIPDVELIADFVPVFDVFFEKTVFRAGFIRQRMAEAAFNRAEADDHVSARARQLRHIAGILIRQRIHQHIRIALRHGVCNGVDKAQQRPHVAALRFVDGTAVFTGAEILIVMLGNRNDPLFVFGDGRQHFLGDDFQHFGVRKTELISGAFAVVQREVLRMRFKIPIGRTVPRRQCMDKTVVGDVAAHFRRDGLSAVGVCFQTDTESRMPNHVRPEAVAVFKYCVFHTAGAFRQVNRFGRQNCFGIGGIPAAANRFLQESIDGIEYAAAAAARQNQVPGRNSNSKVIDAEG